MASQRPGKRIGILGHVGMQNLGDEAIIAAVIQQIRGRYPDAEIIAFTGNPADTEQRHGITTFPIRRGKLRNGSPGASPRPRSPLRDRMRAVVRAVPGVLPLLKGVRNSARFFWSGPAELRFMAQCHHRLKGIDLLIFAGSNQLNDFFGGPWRFPYNLLKWCVLAKSVGAKIAFLCCGAGPLHSQLGKLFIKHSLSLADYRSYRDDVSRRLIESIGISGDNPVCTDLAYGLKLVQPAQREAATSHLTVGINPLPFCDARYWPEQNGERYQNYISKLAAFAVWLDERGHGVVFFPTQLRADPPVIEDIKRLLQSRGADHVGQPLSDRPMSSVDDLIRRLSQMDIVVATRYHGVLLSALLHRPVLAVAYLEKTADLMTQLGQSDYVVDINSFDVTSLTTRFVAIESRADTIRSELEHRTHALRHALEREYDHLFRLLEHASSVGAADERVAALARLNG